MTNLNGAWKHFPETHAQGDGFNAEESHTYYTGNVPLIDIERYGEYLTFRYMFENWIYEEDVKADSLDGVDLFGYAEWMYRNLKTAVPAAIEKFNG